MPPTRIRSSKREIATLKVSSITVDCGAPPSSVTGTGEAVALDRIDRQAQVEIPGQELRVTGQADDVAIRAQLAGRVTMPSICPVRRLMRSMVVLKRNSTPNRSRQ